MKLDFFEKERKADGSCFPWSPECLGKVIWEETLTSTKVNLVLDFREMRRCEVSAVQS